MPTSRVSVTPFQPLGAFVPYKVLTAWVLTKWRLLLIFLFAMMAEVPRMMQTSPKLIASWCRTSPSALERGRDVGCKVRIPACWGQGAVQGK